MFKNKHNGMTTLKKRLNLASISSIIIGLSHHDTEILKIENTYATINFLWSTEPDNKQLHNHEASDSTKKKKKHGSLFIKILTICLTHFYALS
jgi:hypothetical protein